MAQRAGQEEAPRPSEPGHWNSENVVNVTETTAPEGLTQAVECYRCACPGPERLDVHGWVSLNACGDGAALFVCPECQSEPEQEARELLLLFH
jgi:hypothetical protein